MFVSVCVCVCLWLCTENQGTQMKIYVSCAYLCRNVCPGCCHNFFPPPPSLRALFHAFHLTFFVVFFPFFFSFASVVLVSLSMRHFQWLPLFACVARKCGKAAGSHGTSTTTTTAATLLLPRCVFLPRPFWELAMQCTQAPTTRGLQFQFASAGPN